MPTIELTMGRLEEPNKRRLSAALAEAIVRAGIPEELITIIFRHIGPEDVALGRGSFPFWPEVGPSSWPAFARAEITAGWLDDSKKVDIAAAIGTALIEAGVPEGEITIVFRPMHAGDVMVGRGQSPFD